MKSLRFLSFRVLLPVLLMVFAVASPRALAQDSTPAAMDADMGVCSAALGIGMAGDSCINVIHASPDAPAVDVYLDGELALEGVEFGQFSGWIAVPAGEHQVQVTAAGDDAANAVIDANVELAADAAYHVAATGHLADITPQIYQVNLSDLDAMGDPMARIRVIHTSPDAPAVDIALAGGDVLIADLAFPNASDALEVPAGSYDLEVRPTGTTDVALDLPGVELEAGMVYDVFAIGLAGDGSLTVLVIPSTTAAAMMATPTM
ncbi:MAG: DUF4397 domain-containing protein [Thermomicrobiales bacterium]